MNIHSQRLVCAVIGAALVLTACSGDQPAAPEAADLLRWTGNEVPTEEAAALRARWSAEDAGELIAMPLPFPATPEILLDNFRVTYKTMDVKSFDQLLGADFACLLEPSTTALYPELGDALERNEFRTIHRNLFSGQAGSGPDGEYAPPIQQVRFEVLQRVGPWDVMSDTDPFPGSEAAMHGVVVYFDRGEGYSLLRVEGNIRFYVTSHDVMHDGELQPYYRLAGQQDLTDSDKLTETLSWGSILALFR